MTDSLTELKKRIHRELLKAIDAKIETCHAELADLTQSRDTNNKSSAGDKHETGRAMVQIELENKSKQLANYNRQRADLSAISTSRIPEIISTGTLVETVQALYFIAIGIGRFRLDDREIFAISINSPLGNAMKGKTKGESFTFRGVETSILNIA